MAEALPQSKEINPAHDKRIAVSVTSYYCRSHWKSLLELPVSLFRMSVQFVT